MFQQVYPPKEPRPYFFENAAEFLNQPGEWYLNTETNELFYYPQAGENMVTATWLLPD